MMGRHWYPGEADDRAYDVFAELIFRMVNFEYDPSKGRFPLAQNRYHMAKLKRHDSAARR